MSARGSGRRVRHERWRGAGRPLDQGPHRAAGPAPAADRQPSARGVPESSSPCVEFQIRDGTLQGHGVGVRVEPAMSGQGTEALSSAGVVSSDPGAGWPRGRVAFVAGALPGERVLARPAGRRAGVDHYRLMRVLEPSAARTEPFCEAFDRCGGCVLQHATLASQRALREATLFETLARVGRVTPRAQLEPIVGADRGYRRAARLSVIDRRRKRLREDDGGPPVRVGFRARGGDAVAPIRACPVLHPAVGERIGELRALVSDLSVADAVPQIEVAVDDEGRVGAILRHLRPLTDADREALRRFGEAHRWRWWGQSGGPATIAPLDGDTPSALPGAEAREASPPLCYTHPAFDVTIAFEPRDFIQAHGALNRVLVERAVDLLDLAPGHRVIDAFCGLGNFTLPIARRVGATGQVIGLEGDAAMLERAARGARTQGIDWTHYRVVDLFDPAAIEAALRPWLTPPAPERATAEPEVGAIDRVLLDPPRAGAAEWVPYLARLGVPRVVYVSCNPASLARDVGELVHRHGYRLEAAGIADMFPHTAHVESIAVLVRDGA